MKAILALAGFVAVSLSAGQAPRLGIHPPRLVVLVSIDQFRADYLERFAPHYLPARSGGKVGGFRYLMEQGAWYRDAHHNHVPTATGPGHATLMTGSEPFLDGIIGNDWYDRANHRSTYVVDDPSVETVGGPSKPMSPMNLKVTTVGDELKEATGGRSKVVGIAFKDRAAILMAGHAADTVIWFDPSNGNWVTSSWYAPSKRLPAWVEKWNSERLVDKSAGQSWTPFLPADAYSLTRTNPNEKAVASGVFSHPLGETPGKGYYGNFVKTSQGQSYVFQTVERALDEEKLGQHDVPDVLVVNLSTNDYVGHQYGPNSPEVMDISVRTDRLISDLLNSLDHRVGLGNVDFVLTADHGVLPVPEDVHAYKIGSLRQAADIGHLVKAALDTKFGEGDWVLGGGLYEQNFYLNHDTIAAKGLKLNDVIGAAADAASQISGIFAVFTRQQILHNEMPNWDWTKLAVNGFGSTLGGDLMIFEGPGTYMGGGTGTGHGSAWMYDTHVPILIAGAGIRPGVYNRLVHTSDIASTLCHLIGIEYPTGNVGHPLVEALK